jgi:hypothetical protein
MVNELCENKGHVIDSDENKHCSRCGERLYEREDGVIESFKERSKRLLKEQKDVLDRLE